MDVLEGIVELAHASKVTVWQPILKWFTGRNGVKEADTETQKK